MYKIILQYCTVFLVCETELLKNYQAEFGKMIKLIMKFQEILPDWMKFYQTWTDGPVGVADWQSVQNIQWENHSPVREMDFGSATQKKKM